MPLDIAVAGAIVGLISSAMQITNMVCDTWQQKKERGKVQDTSPAHHRMVIEGAPDNSALVSTDGQIVTRDQLANLLNHDDYDYLQVLETRMKQVGRQWMDITKGIELETNLRNKSIYEQQLDQIKDNLGKMLNQILKFIERCGFYLDDHYNHIRSITETN